MKLVNVNEKLTNENSGVELMFLVRYGLINKLSLIGK